MFYSLEIKELKIFLGVSIFVPLGLSPCVYYALTFHLSQYLCRFCKLCPVNWFLSHSHEGDRVLCMRDWLCWSSYKNIHQSSYSQLLGLLFWVKLSITILEWWLKTQLSY